MAIVGKDTKFCIGKESSWATGVSVDEQLPFLTESLGRNINQIENQYLDGETAISGITNNTREASGAVVCEAVYDTIAGDPFGIDGLINAALGGGAYDSGSGYAVYQPTDALAVSNTVAVLKGTTVQEIVGAKVASLEITGQAGGNIQITANFVGEDMILTGESGVTNTTSTFNAVGPTSSPSPVRFDQLTFRLDTLGAALSSTDNKCISAFTLTIDNVLSGAQYASVCTENSDSLTTMEPIRDGKRRVTLSITYPRFTSISDFTQHSAGTELQASLSFTNGTYLFDILLPRIRITNAQAPVTGPGILNKTIEFLAINNNGVNTAMETAAENAVTYEIAIQTKNARTAVA